jgi:DNA polymerase-3 subunit alpha
MTLKGGGSGVIQQLKEDESFERVINEFEQGSTDQESARVVEMDDGIAESEPNAAIDEEGQEFVEKESVDPVEMEDDYLVKQGGGSEEQHILVEDTVNIEVPESVLAKGVSKEDQQDENEQVLSDSIGAASPNHQVSAADTAISGSIELPPFIVPPTPGLKEDQQVQMMTIVIRSTGDKTRDELRMRMLHGVITSYPGNDRFAFHVFVQGRGYLLEFPNCTIGLCPELIDRLSTFVGIKNVRVDPIMFQ